MDVQQPTTGTRAKRKTQSNKQKTLPCQYCDRLFARLEHLQRHIRTHTKEKPFICEICNKSFARSDLLVRHERLVHPGEEELHTSRKTTKHRNSTSHSHQHNASQSKIPVQQQPSGEPEPMDLTSQATQALLSPSHAHDARGMLDMLDPQLMQPQNAMHSIDSMPSQQAALLGTPSLDPSWGYDLNLLSHAASHVASNGQNQYDLSSMAQVAQDQLPDAMQEPMPEGMQEPMQQLMPVSSEGQYPPQRMLTEGYGQQPPMFETPDLGDPVQDFTVFLDSIGLSSDWHATIFNSETQPGDAFVSSEGKQPNGETSIDSKIAPPHDESSSFSRFGSRLPSLQPEPRDPDSIRSEPRTFEELTLARNKTSWEVSDADRQHFASKLAAFDSVMPKGFIAPSRHSLSRYLAGYINGFHEHLPFIHVPTLSVSNSGPELVLALAAVGAQYRFENSRGIELFYAAKAVVIEQIKRRDGFAIPQSWNRPRTRTGSMVQSPTGFQVMSSASSISPFQPVLNTEEAITADGKEHLDSIQALLLLTAFATWERHQELLREALAFQSVLARLVRESGLVNVDIHPGPEDMTWEEWVRVEGEKRTKLIVYCFFNLHSITWNVPPLILNSELKLDLPAPANLWKASNAETWQKLHTANNVPPTSFQVAFARLFARPTQVPEHHVSPLGNYVLVHALIQQIFFARQLSLNWPTVTGSNLRLEDITVLERALAAWKSGWKRNPESSLDPQSPNGPVAFTSTALLGLAYIRLHVDMGPLRHLETRDSYQIAAALHSSPPIRRDPRLTPALLHSAHALSIPVRLGIDFVAKTQSFFWSIQHSLCSLECAFLLSKWLNALANSIPEDQTTLSEHERKLLVWVRSMLDETESANPLQDPSNANSTLLNGNDNETNQKVGTNDSGDSNSAIDHRLSDPNRDLVIGDENKIRELSVSVVRVWSKTFKGNTSWAIVDLIGNALDVYGGMLEDDIRGLSS